MRDEHGNDLNYRRPTVDPDDLRPSLRNLVGGDGSVIFATAARILARLNRLADDVSPFDRSLVENAKDDIITIMKGE